MMETRYPFHPSTIKNFTTAQLREEFLIPTLFVDGELTLVCSHIDRVIIGGAAPLAEPISLTADLKDMGVEYFLQRRDQFCTGTRFQQVAGCLGEHCFGKALTIQVLCDKDRMYARKLLLDSSDRLNAVDYGQSCFGQNQIGSKLENQIDKGPAIPSCTNDVKLRLKDVLQPFQHQHVFVSQDDPRPLHK